MNNSLTMAIDYQEVLADLRYRRRVLDKTIFALRCVIGDIEALTFNDLSGAIRGSKWIATSESEGCENIIAYGDTAEEVGDLARRTCIPMLRVVKACELYRPEVEYVK